MVEELKLAVKVDDDIIEQSLLKQFNNAEKLADKVVFTFKNVNLDNKEIEKQFKDMQKLAGKNPIELPIDTDKSLKMLQALGDEFTRIISIAKGTSVKPSSLFNQLIDTSDIKKGSDELNSALASAMQRMKDLYDSGQKESIEYYATLYKIIEIQKKMWQFNGMGKKSSFDSAPNVKDASERMKIQDDIYDDFRKYSDVASDTVDFVISEFSRLKSTGEGIFKENGKIISKSMMSSLMDMEFDGKYFEQLEKQEQQALATAQAEEKLAETEKNLGKSTSTVDDSKFDELKADVTEIREELNGVKEKISTIDSEGFEHVKADVEKTVESVKELNSELTEVKSKLDNTSTTPVETNISSGNLDTATTATSVDKVTNSLIEEQKAIGELDMAFRGVEGSLNGFMSTSGRLATFFTDSPYLARQYADSLGGVYQASLALGNSLEINGKGRDWNAIEYLGDGSDEASKKIIELRNQINALYDQLQSLNVDGTGLNGRVEVNREDYSYLVQCFGDMKQEYDSYIEAVEKGNVIENQSSENAKSLMIQLYELEKAYKAISDAKTNVYGTHTTDEFAELAKLNGYDSVMFRNIKDSFDKLSRLTSVGVIFDESQVANATIVNDKIDELVRKLDRISASGLNLPLNIELPKEISKLQDGSFVNNLTGEIFDDLQEALKSLKELSSIADPIKDTFQEETDSSGMEKIATTTEEAVQAKKDFATANESVQDSVDASKSKLELETELMERLAKSARDAADAKKEFVEANKQVQDSVDDTPNKGKYKNRKKISEDDYTSQADDYASIANQRLTASGYTILGKSVSTELVDGLVKVTAKIKTADDVWKSFSARIDSDGNMFKQYFRTITKGVDKLEKELNNLTESSADSLEQKNSEISDIAKKIPDYQKKLNKFDIVPNAEWTRYPLYAANIEQLSANIERLQELSQKDINLIDSEDIAGAKQLQENIEKLINSMSNMSAGDKGFDPLSADKALEKINSELRKNPAMSKEAKDQIQALYKEIASGNPSKPIKELLHEMYRLIQAERLAGRAGKGFINIFKDKVIYGAAGQLAGMIGLYDVIDILKEGTEVIRKFDSAMAEMRKVSDESAKSLKNLQDVSFDLADNVGTTAIQIQNSIADFMRIGDSVKDAQKHAVDANTLLQVSEFDNIEDATSALVSMNQAWKDIDSQHINDVLNILGNNMPIATDELASSLQRSAGTLATLGSTLEEAAALTVAGNSILQDPDSVAAGKLFARTHGNMWVFI